MGDATWVAVQVLITAQVFLLGLAASQYQSDVVGKLRTSLDELRRDIISQGPAPSVADFDRVESKASATGLEFDDFFTSRLASGVRIQLFLSLAVGAAVAALLWPALVVLSAWPLTAMDAEGWALYAVIGASLFGPLSVLLQVVVARRSMSRTRDHVIVTCIDHPDLAIPVVQHLATPPEREQLENSLRLMTIRPAFRLTGDPRSSAVAAGFVSSAAERYYGGSGEPMVEALICQSALTAESGDHEKSLLLARRAHCLAVALPSPVRLRAAQNLANRMAEQGDSEVKDGAYESLRNAIESCKDLDARHPAKLDASLSLLFLAPDSDDRRASVRHLERELAFLGQVRGRTDPSYVRVLLNVLMLRSAGMRDSDPEHADLLKEYESLVSSLIQEYGEDHLLALEARLALAARSNSQEALDSVADACQSVLGPGHPLTVEADVIRQERIAVSLLRRADAAKKARESAFLQEESEFRLPEGGISDLEILVERCTQALGPDSDTTQRARDLLEKYRAQV
jgi:hypothetical protein